MNQCPLHDKCLSPTEECYHRQVHEPTVNCCYTNGECTERCTEVNDNLLLWEIEILKVSQLQQAQDSLSDQLARLRIIANKFGLYDAADFLRSKEVSPDGK